VEDIPGGRGARASRQDRQRRFGASTILEHFLPEKRNQRYNRHCHEQGQKFLLRGGRVVNGESWDKNFFCPGGHDKRLKRLIPDKEFQGNQSPFLGKIWLGLGSAWLGFDIFCFGLDIQQ
jgi:hypothetical protein